MRDAAAFARRWCEAWNAHDLDAVLEHFHDDVIFTSPMAARLMPETRGILVGKSALRAYWAEGLRRFPELNFAVESVFAGVDTVVIQYRNHAGVTVDEVLTFDGKKVRTGHGTYPVDPA